MTTADRSPLEDARALVERWQKSLGARSELPDTPRIMLTVGAKTRMAREIAALIEDTLRRREYTAD